jgi:hypothetical protein
MLPLPIFVVATVPIVFPTGFALALAHPGMFIDELIPVLDGCHLDAHDYTLLGISLDDLVAFGLYVGHLVSSLAVVEFAQSRRFVVVADGGGGTKIGEGQYGDGAGNMIDHVLRGID